MLTRGFTIALTLIVGGRLLLAGAPPQAARTKGDWPQWRGPQRDGVVSVQLPAEWPATLTKRWQIEVGGGHSSPVIAGNRVVILARQGEEEIVRALDLASGREVWRAEYPAPYSVNPAARGHGPGPKATPAIADARVFTFGIGGILSALDLATGKLLWRTPPPAVLPEYGTAMSPLVDGTAVIAHMGGLDNGALTAFDVATGAPRWRWTGDGPGYGSSIIATIAGQRQLITQTQKLMVGLNVSDGKLLWQQPFSTSYNQNAVTPIAYGDVVVFSGLDKPITAVRIGRKGSQWTAESLWTNEQLPLYMSSPVMSEMTIYGLSHRNRGQLFALDARTGKTSWTTEGRVGENASILSSPSWLLVSTTGGELIVGQRSPAKWQEVRRYQVADSALWAHPAISNGSIVVKDASKVICWGF
jgi:outer membrane protein assembly factor BamB